MTETVARPKRSDLATRLIFGPAMLALVAGVYALDVYYTRGLATAVALGLLALGGMLEYSSMMRRAGSPVAGGALLLATGLLCGSAVVSSGWVSLDGGLEPVVIATFALLFLVAVSGLAPGRMKQALDAQGATLLGFVWIAWPLFMAQGMAIHHLPSVLFVVLVCKSGDIGAYFFGRALGRHKLIPHVSKGKTVEGAVGSVVTSCAVAYGLVGVLTPPEAEFGLTAAIGIGIMLNLGAQIGDLIESLLKRTCGVKDSSTLLPAHGGILDLVDSLLFSFPAYFLILVSVT